MSATLCPHDLSERITEELKAAIRDDALEVADNGIGAYEFWGVSSYDSQIVVELTADSIELDVTGVDNRDLEELGSLVFDVYARGDDDLNVTVEARLWCFDRRDGKTFAVYTLRDAS